jgi:hypothetical protein
LRQLLRAERLRKVGANRRYAIFQYQYIGVGYLVSDAILHSGN